jgi:low affinity Fe/Cu permease
MKKRSTYQRIESSFEKLVGAALKLYGHPFTFSAALILVIFFLVTSAKTYTNLRDLVRDIILCITFLSFFIIQRAVNKTTTAVRIKMNELIVSQDKANNEIATIEEKTETEIEEIDDKFKQQKTD